MITRPSRRAAIGVLAGTLLGLLPTALVAVGLDSPPFSPPSPPVGTISNPSCGPRAVPGTGSSMQLEIELRLAGNGPVTYSANCRGTRQLFTVQPDGSGARQITTAGGDAPEWSRQGDRLVFERGPIGSRDLVSMDSQGRETVLASHPADDSGPSWSPDGRSIVFASRRGGAGPVLHVMAADGSNIRAIPGAPGTNPSWSPVGDRIAFVRFVPPSSGNAIFSIRADGSELTPLTELALGSYDDHPQWSPDGRRIVYSGGGDKCPRRLFLVNSDGSGEASLDQSLPPGAACAGEPSWSPDGSRIAFRLTFGGERRDVDSGIYTIRPEGTDLRALLFDQSAGSPTWQPLTRASLRGTIVSIVQRLVSILFRMLRLGGIG